MNENFLMFGDITIDKRKFLYTLSPILVVENVNINETLKYNKFSFGKKGYQFFTGYKYHN